MRRQSGSVGKATERRRRWHGGHFARSASWWSVRRGAACGKNPQMPVPDAVCTRKTRRIPLSLWDWQFGNIKRLAVVGLIAVAAVGTAAVAATSTPAGAASGWQVSKGFPSPIISITGVSCASTTVCEAIGSNSNGAAVIFGTTNSGSTWTRQTIPTIPSGLSSLYGISCASTTACETVGYSSTGGAVLGTTDGGSTWTSQTIPTSLTGLYGISCASATACEATGSNTSGPAILAQPTAVRPGRARRFRSDPAVSVRSPAPRRPSAEATGSNTSGPVILGTTNGGSTWTSQTVPSGPSNLSGISCASTTVCEVVGSEFERGSDPRHYERRVDLDEPDGPERGPA